MQDKYYTQTGERPDLALIPVNPPEEFIGDRIFPIAPMGEKSGKLFYATVVADVAAQTDRATGAGPTKTQIAGTSTDFVAAEVCKRGAISPDEVKTYGSIEKADAIGAKFAKRSVLIARETAQCSALLTGAATTLDVTKILTQVQDALQAVRRYTGKTVLVTATRNCKSIIQDILADSTFGPGFARIIGPTPANLNHHQMVSALALMIGVDEVLAGDDSIWNAEAVEGRMAIAKIDTSGDALAHKYLPILGKTVQFMPDGENPWNIQSVGDRTDVNNYYDAYNWYQVLTLNSGARVIFDGIRQ